MLDRYIYRKTETISELINWQTDTEINVGISQTENTTKLTEKTDTIGYFGIR